MSSQAIPDAAPARDTQPRMALLLAAMIGFFVMGSGMSIFGPALPVFSRDFALDAVTASWLVSTQWTGCLMGVVGVYFLWQRLTARPGLAAMALGLAALALAPGWGTALAGAFVFGLGYGVTAALFNPRVLVAFGARGPAMVSLINAVFSLGAIASPFGFVLAGETPRPVFAILSVLAVVTVLVAGRAGMAGLAAGSANTGFRLNLPILIVVFLCSGIEVTLAGLGPTALIRTGLSPAVAAQLLSVFFLLALIVRVVLTLVADRIPSFALTTFAVFWVAAMALGVVYLGPTVCFPAMGTSAGLFFQGSYVTATRKMGQDPRVASLALGTMLGGSAVSPLVYSRLMEPAGTHGLFWLIAVVAGALGLACLALYRSMRG